MPANVVVASETNPCGAAVKRGNDSTESKCVQKRADGRESFVKKPSCLRSRGVAAEGHWETISSFCWWRIEVQREDREGKL